MDLRNDVDVNVEVNLVGFVDDNNVISSTPASAGDPSGATVAQTLSDHHTYLGTISKDNKGKTMSTSGTPRATTTQSLNEKGRYVDVRTKAVAPTPHDPSVAGQNTPRSLGNIKVLGTPVGHDALAGAKEAGDRICSRFAHHVSNITSHPSQIALLALGSPVQQLLAATVTVCPSADMLHDWTSQLGKTVLKAAHLDSCHLDHATALAMAAPTNLAGLGMPNVRSLTMARVAVINQSILGAPATNVRNLGRAPTASRHANATAEQTSDHDPLPASWDGAHDRMSEMMASAGLSFHYPTAPIATVHELSDHAALLDMMPEGFTIDYLHDWARCLMTPNNHAYRALRPEEAHGQCCIPHLNWARHVLNSIILHGTHAPISHGTHLTSDVLIAAYFACHSKTRVSDIVLVDLDATATDQDIVITRLDSLVAQAALSGDNLLSPAASKLALRSKEIFVTGPIRAGDPPWLKTISLPPHLTGVSYGRTMEDFVNNPPQDLVRALAAHLSTIVPVDSQIDMYTDGSHAHGRDNLMTLHATLHPLPSATPSSPPTDFSGASWFTAARSHADTHQRTLVWMYFGPSTDETCRNEPLHSCNWGWFLTACTGTLATAKCTTILLEDGREARSDRWHNANTASRERLSIRTTRHDSMTLDLRKRIWLPAAALADIRRISAIASSVTTTDITVADVPEHYLNAPDFITDQLLRLHRVITAIGSAMWDAQTRGHDMHEHFSAAAKKAAATIHGDPHCLSCPDTPQTRGTAALQRRKSSEVQATRVKVAQRTTLLTAQNFHAARAMHLLGLDRLHSGYVGETSSASAFCKCLLTDSADARASLCSLSTRTTEFEKNWASTFAAATDPDGATADGEFTLTKGQADDQTEYFCACGRPFDSELGRDIHMATAVTEAPHFVPPSETDQTGGGWVLHTDADVVAGASRHPMAPGGLGSSVFSEAHTALDASLDLLCRTDGANLQTRTLRWICDCLSLLDLIAEDSASTNTARKQARRSQNPTTQQLRATMRRLHTSVQSKQDVWVPCEHDLTDLSRALEWCQEHRGNNACDSLAKWMLRQSWPGDPKFITGLGPQDATSTYGVYATLNHCLITRDLSSTIQRRADLANPGTSGHSSRCRMHHATSTTWDRRWHRHRSSSP